jgi:hypothetical protein
MPFLFGGKMKVIIKGIEIQIDKDELWRIKKYQASIQINGKHIHLGYYFILEDAYNAYCAAAKKYHGEFARLA